MNILLINSSDQNAFVALYDGTNLHVSYSSDFINVTKKQPDNLINCLNHIKENFSDKFANISAIAVTTGPGSFTGIRVGLAIAKGAAGAMDIPIIPLTNFEVIHNRIKGKSSHLKYYLFIPAKLPEYYYSLWLNGNEIEKEYIDINQISSISEKNAVIVGNFDAETKAKHSYFEFLNNDNLGSEADSILSLALYHFENGALKQPGDIEPLYLIDFKLRK